jgi:hypothetical protein
MNFVSNHNHSPNTKISKSNIFSTATLRPTRKRRRLEEEFESLSIEDESEKIKINFSSEMDSNYLKSQYDKVQFKSCGRKRRHNDVEKSAMDDFSEIRRKIEEIEYTYKCTDKWRCTKKRDQKSSDKEMQLATNDQVSFETVVFKFIERSRESFPKLYSKLLEVLKYENTMSTYCKDHQFINFGYDYFKPDYVTVMESRKEVLDGFLKKLNKASIRVNSKIADEVIVKML